MNITPNPANIYAPGVAPQFRDGSRSTQKRTAKLYQVQRHVVAPCGHSLSPVFSPHTNCDHCWAYYFSINRGLAKALFEELKDGKEADLVAAHGIKYVKKLKMFVGVVNLLAKMHKETNDIEPNPEDSGKEETAA